MVNEKIDWEIKQLENLLIEIENSDNTEKTKEKEKLAVALAVSSVMMLIAVYFAHNYFQIKEYWRYSITHLSGAVLACSFFYYRSMVGWKGIVAYIDKEKISNRIDELKK